MAAFSTLLAAFVVAFVSVSLAGALSFRMQRGFVQRMVSFSIGVLLATAFLHLIPEALESTIPARTLCAVVLAGVLAFFFLEKIALYRHSHHFEGDGHHHHHGHDAHEAGRGGVFVLIGSAVHSFSDGVVIAGAFLAGPWVGLAATLSILAHEVPHKIGDFIVLINAGVPRAKAVAYAAGSSATILVGGVAGLAFLERITTAIPYVLVIAASNFIYISLSDLVPQMQRFGMEDDGHHAHGGRARDAAIQAALIAFGVLLVVVRKRPADH